ncbi:zinc-binding dehydrogenase [Frankia sp. Cppng1_Ct_nod]|uniref:zinc-binding dehydrogenase n=1 Tax=Frankia sp. Cppng1_Ct_nod TaxID=2897162 RepID=UPI00104198F0|nr:zinc-binding dehydrogenase [Frankia sp. Cppng1_Ct_nod]
MSSCATAAAVPEAFLTAYDALFTLARIQPGERVLIHAVGSGVGTAALQLANLAGAITVGTSRSATKLAAARRLGLDHGQLAPASPSDIRDAAGPVDVVLDLVGTDLAASIAASIAATASQGRIVLLGALARRDQPLDLVELLSRRLTLHGSMLRTRSHTEKTALTRLLAQRIGPLVRTNRLQPIIDTIYPADQAETAFDHLGNDTTFGKLILDFTGHPSPAE